MLGEQILFLESKFDLKYVLYNKINSTLTLEMTAEKISIDLKKLKNPNTFNNLVKTPTHANNKIMEFESNGTLYKLMTDGIDNAEKRIIDLEGVKEYRIHLNNSYGIYS